MSGVGKIPAHLRPLPDAPCLMCDARPVEGIGLFEPRPLTRAGWHRQVYYALCTACADEIRKEDTRAAALQAIERCIEAQLRGMPR